jgi:hypothetical protein
VRDTPDENPPPSLVGAGDDGACGCRPGFGRDAACGSVWARPLYISVVVCGG